MKLRTRKLLVNCASLGCLMAACWLVFGAFTTSPPPVEAKPAQSRRARIAKATTAQQQSINVQSKGWQRTLRRPLYDPPPPPKVVVKKVVRPITVKLTGTVLEPNNSQAFLKLANGSMALRKIGDQVTNDPRDGKIIEITASEIVIQREDDEVRLKVGG